MITKGIIKSIDYNGNTCTVRIPFFETANNDEIISTAPISNTPGSYNGYKVDDVVWVAFEDGSMDNPVVIGKLYLGVEVEKADPRGTLNVVDSKVSNSAEIPFDTKLGSNVADSVANTNVPFSSLEQVANSLNTAEVNIAQNDRDYGNRFKQTYAEIDATGKKITTNLEQTASEIRAEVKSTKETLEGTISETKTALEIADGKISAEVGTKLSTNSEAVEKNLGWDLNEESWKIYAKDTVEVNGESVVKPFDIVTIDRDGMKLAGDLKISGYPSDINVRYAQNDSATSHPELFTDSEKRTINTDDWKTETPEWINGKFIWQWTETIKYDYDKTKSSWDTIYDDKVVCLTGQAGEAALSYWLATSTLVHTGKEQLADIHITPMKKLGTTLEAEQVDDTAYIRYAWGTAEMSDNWSNSWKDSTEKSFIITKDEIANNETDLRVEAAHKVDNNYIVYDSQTITYAPKNTPVLVLTNEADFILYDDATNKTDTTSVVTSTAQIKLNNTPIKSNVVYEWTTSETDCDFTMSTKEVRNDTVTVKTIPDNEVILTCKATYTSPSGQVYDNFTKDFVVKKVVNATSYWLSVSSFIHTGPEQAADIQIKAYKKSGVKQEVVDTSAEIFINDVSKSSNGTYTLSTSDIKKLTSDITVVAKHDDIEYDREVIEYSPNTPIIALTNDAGQIKVDKAGQITGTTTTAKLYIKGQEITDSSLVSFSWDDGTAGATLTVEDIVNNSQTFTCTATYNGNTYTKTFTVTKLTDGEDIKFVTATAWKHNGTSTPGGCSVCVNNNPSILGTTYDYFASRGHTVIVINPATYKVDSKNTFDTYDNVETTTNALITHLNSIEATKIVCIVSWDACSCTEALRNKLYEFGAGNTSTWTSARCAHTFIGMKGLAKGQAYEGIRLPGTEPHNISVTAYFTANGIVVNQANHINSVITEYTRTLKAATSVPVNATWSETPPTYLDGYIWWKREKTTFTDGSISYTNPVKDTAINETYALAQGKTTNYYSSTDPAGTSGSSNYGENIKNGDCWFKTISNDSAEYNNETSGSQGKLLQWNGTRWEDIGGELVANKVTANFINAMDITAKKIEVLDSNNTDIIFRADGTSGSETSNSVKIGGFQVTKDSLVGGDPSIGSNIGLRVNEIQNEVYEKSYTFNDLFTTDTDSNVEDVSVIDTGWFYKDEVGDYAWFTSFVERSDRTDEQSYGTYKVPGVWHGLKIHLERDIPGEFPIYLSVQNAVQTNTNKLDYVFATPPILDEYNIECLNVAHSIFAGHYEGGELDWFTGELEEGVDIAAQTTQAFIPTELNKMLKVVYHDLKADTSIFIFFMSRNPGPSTSSSYVHNEADGRSYAYVAIPNKVSIPITSMQIGSNFRIGANGKLFAKDATLTGQVIASNGGFFGNVNINQSSIKSDGYILDQEGLRLADKNRIKLGDSQNLQLFYNGSESIINSFAPLNIQNTNGGNIKLSNSATEIKQKITISYTATEVVKTSSFAMVDKNLSFTWDDSVGGGTGGSSLEKSFKIRISVTVKNESNATAQCAKSISFPLYIHYWNGSSSTSKTININLKRGDTSITESTTINTSQYGYVQGISLNGVSYKSAETKNITTTDDENTTPKVEINGSLYINGTQYPNSSSDRRIKNNIMDLANDNDYNTLFKELKPKAYTLNNDPAKKIHLGFIAQEVEETINKCINKPNLGIVDKNQDTDLYSINYFDIIALNTFQIQQLINHINDLENELVLLKSQKGINKNDQ